MSILVLNWRNSFFGRIFLWFWFVTLTSLAAGILVANFLAPADEISTPSAVQLQQLERAAARIERIPNLNINRLQRILSQMSDSRARLAFVIDIQSGEFYYGFKPPARARLNTYRQLLDESEPVVITKAGTRFIGPMKVTIAGRDYGLFMGTTRLPPESRAQLFIIVGLVAVLVSGLLCFWLARSFARPLSEIQSATTRLASGDLAARVSLSHRRGDEFAQLTDETNKMAEQLQQLFSEHQRFLADVSHELRSPLTRLQMAIGIAEQTIESTQNSQIDLKLIQRVVKEADQIDNMIGQLLWLSRHEAQLEAFKPESIEAENLTHAMLEDLKFEAQGQAKTVNITWHDSANTQIIWVDSEMILHALENIFRNAVKYATSAVDINIRAQSSILTIDVADDGPGVSETDLVKIFKPFYRTDQSRTRDSGGTGLGLSIAQRAIERHGGSIVAKIRQPTGLIVSIGLPLLSENIHVASR